MNYKLILIIGALLGLSACTSLNVDLPIARFDLPETNGAAEHRSQISAQVEPTQNYQAVDDASIRPPTFNPRMQHMATAGVHGSVGLAENLDIAVRSSFTHSPTALSLKYQILGSPLSTAEPNSWSLAVSGAVGYSDFTRNGDQNGILGPGGYGWDGRMRTTMTDAAVLVGRRLNEQIMLYSSVFYSNYRIETKINQAASDNGSSPAASYQFSTNGYQRGANLGIAFNVQKDAIAKLEVVYSDINIAPVDDSFLTYGASFGLRF